MDKSRYTLERKTQLNEAVKVDEKVCVVLFSWNKF